MTKTSENVSIQIVFTMKTVLVGCMGYEAHKTISRFDVSKGFEMECWFVNLNLIWAFNSRSDTSYCE